MKVRVRDEPQTVGEMMVGSDEMGLVAEMITEPAKLRDFGFPPEIVTKAEQIKVATEDDKPEFPVVRVEEGWSGSGRLWPAREIDRIVAQTNELEPVGHLGHIPDAEEATAMPDVQTTWLGAVAKTEASKQKDRVGEMVKVAYFAGYNHPGAKIRTLLRARAARGISWWGRAHQVPIPGKGVEMKDFDLKALDWARKLSEGMPTSRVVAIAREMEGKRMDKELSQVTPEEFEKENPNAYALIVARIKAEQDQTIGEMQAKIDEGDKAKSKLQLAMEALGVEDAEKLVDKINEIKTRVGDRAKATRDKLLTELLATKVPDERTRSYVQALLPVGEMESAVADAKDEEEAKKVVGEMVDKSFNENDLIKGLVSEAIPPVVRRREDLSRKAGSDDLGDYAQGRSARPVGA